MTLEKLQSLPEPVLRQLAARLRVFVGDRVGRNDLAAAVLEAIAEDQEESASAAPRFWSELSKYDLGHDNIDLVDDAELRLPSTYGATYLLVLQRDPSWFYVMWDYANDFLHRWGITPNSPMILRIGRCECGKMGQMKIEYSARIRVRMRDRRHYVNLLWRQSSRCWAELCLAQSRPQPVMRSATFSIFSPAVPVDRLSERQKKLLRVSALQLEESPALGTGTFQEAGEL